MLIQNQDSLTETQLDTERVFDGILLKVERDHVRLPDGKTAVREYIRHPGAVVVIATLPDGRLILERQFRYPLRRSFIELPAGKIDPGEDIEACARRELREEVGYEAARWTHLGTLHPCIGYSDERIEVFLAEDLTHVGHQWDEGEFLEVLSLSPAELDAAVASGDVTDGKTLSALYIARARGI
ncbi:NUDIX domain-containing protein [Denitromonas halophila]|uniref:GDP-mannose pyrophosphatase n=1 Tax=Denitromonas halophila TaxID=1629404 RepID=A0A557QQY6_9RHOO|nr:NUDIX hydrolase [Denitromonas halophila]TVO55313.1 NUDIX hydrolase [Denitromonas halophila]